MEDQYDLNTYNTIGLIALIEIPAYLGNNSNFNNLDHHIFFSANAFLMDIVGRKPMILFHVIMGAVSCIAVLIPMQGKYALAFILFTLLLKSSVSGALTMIRSDFHIN